jgi:hypothetical protein
MTSSWRWGGCVPNQLTSKWTALASLQTMIGGEGRDLGYRWRLLSSDTPMSVRRGCAPLLTRDLTRTAANNTAISPVSVSPSSLNSFKKVFIGSKRLLEGFYVILPV